MKSSWRKKGRREREGRRKREERDQKKKRKDSAGKKREHKAGREKHSARGKNTTLRALKDRNISVEINCKKKMRGTIYWQGKGLFGISRNGSEKWIITGEIVRMLKSGAPWFVLRECSHLIKLARCLVFNHNKKTLMEVKPSPQRMATRSV